jgi:hypothetical protein
MVWILGLLYLQPGSTVKMAAADAIRTYGPNSAAAVNATQSRTLQNTM